MTRNAPFLAVALASAVLLMGCASPDRRAEEPKAPVEGGIGGTGIQIAGDEGGIGGTGAPTAAAVGTVTGFGSIHLNGLRVVLPDGAEAMDGGRVPESEIGLGETVEIIGVLRQDGTVEAREALVTYALIAPVQAVSVDGRVLDVFGVRVTVDPGTPVVDEDGASMNVRVGDRVAVSGLPRDGVISASRIEAREGNGVEAYGVVKRGSIHGGGGTIHGIPVRAAVAGRSMLTGVPVVIGARVGENGDLLAHSVRRGLLATVNAGLTDVSVEGYLSPRSDAATGYEIEGFAYPLEAGSKVKVLAGDRAVFIGSVEGGMFRVRHGLPLPNDTRARRDRLEAVRNGYAPAGALPTR